MNGNKYGFVKKARIVDMLHNEDPLLSGSIYVGDDIVGGGEYADYSLPTIKNIVDAASRNYEDITREVVPSAPKSKTKNQPTDDAPLLPKYETPKAPGEPGSFSNPIKERRINRETGEIDDHNIVFRIDGYDNNNNPRGSWIALSPSEYAQQESYLRSKGIDPSKLIGFLKPHDIFAAAKESQQPAANAVVPGAMTDAQKKIFEEKEKAKTEAEKLSRAFEEEYKNRYGIEPSAPSASLFKGLAPGSSISTQIADPISDARNMENYEKNFKVAQEKYERAKKAAAEMNAFAEAYNKKSLGYGEGAFINFGDESRKSKLLNPELRLSSTGAKTFRVPRMEEPVFTPPDKPEVPKINVAVQSSQPSSAGIGGGARSKEATNGFIALGSKVYNRSNPAMTFNLMEDVKKTVATYKGVTPDHISFVVNQNFESTADKGSVPLTSSNERVPLRTPNFKDNNRSIGDHSGWSLNGMTYDVIKSVRKALNNNPQLVNSNDKYYRAILNLTDDTGALQVAKAFKLQNGQYVATDDFNLIYTFANDVANFVSGNMSALSSQFNNIRKLPDFDWRNYKEQDASVNLRRIFPYVKSEIRNVPGVEKSFPEFMAYVLHLHLFGQATNN